MTAFHTMILFSDGAPLTPAGGSSCSLILDRVLHTEVSTTKKILYYYPFMWSTGQEVNNVKNGSEACYVQINRKY